MNKERWGQFLYTHEGDWLYLKASSTAGALWKRCENRRPPGVSEFSSESFQRTISALDAGFKNPRDAVSCERISELHDEDWRTYEIETLTERRQATINGMEDIWRMLHPHVSYNSGDNEWYTPKQYIEAARKVMGGIDLDPASSHEANKIVQATRYYTIEDNGLILPWSGRVWLNPPYSLDLMGKFIDRLCMYCKNGEVTEAIVLVNNATETGWFNKLVSIGRDVCFIRGRVRFWGPEGEMGAPLQGQACIYCGDNERKFYEEFKRFGWIAIIEA